MTSPHAAHAQSLGRFIDRSPSPYHVVDTAMQVLGDAGFATVRPEDELPVGPGRYALPHDGSLLAWVIPDGDGPRPFHIIGAHTDSPNLRLKPRPDVVGTGYRRLAVEVYGGALLNSWLDRDLGLSGRISVRGDGPVPTSTLVRIDHPIARIPQLAIHLDRDVNDKGLVLNRQQHLVPIVGAAESRPIMEQISEATGVSPADIVGADLMLHDTEPARLIGADDEYISAPRLDNQVSCHAAVTALTGAASVDAVQVIALFDHEEVGSVSSTGAATDRLRRLLSGISHGAGGSSGHDRVLAGSLFVSADNAHATHPNYPDRHDPDHVVAMNGGPVLKFNSNQRYTTDAISAGTFRLAAERAGVTIQEFVSRSDMPCGSTIGPTVAANLGVRALDVGCAQLAMHSCRELAGARDPWDLTLVLAELLA